MFDDDAQVATSLLASIHDQLEPHQARELTFFASDDLVVFCASALSKVSSGELALSPEQVAFLNRGLRQIHAEPERPARG